jgi:2-oxo-4-hydroxy-4-carboxy-5-ureidoimidazoline decarboxylase
VKLASFNELPDQTAEHELLMCCSAPRWAGEVAAGRPYQGLDQLLRAADRALREVDLDAGLAGHPRIGERTTSATSRREQAGVAGAPAEVLAALREGNQAYERRFGHVYLVCATGRSAVELLDVLHARLANDEPTERRTVRAELVKINRIRLVKLFEEESP